MSCDFSIDLPLGRFWEVGHTFFSWSGIILLARVSLHVLKMDIGYSGSTSSKSCVYTNRLRSFPCSFSVGSCGDLEGRRELEGGDSGSDTGDPGNVSDICWCQFPVPQFFRESRVVT